MTIMERRAARAEKDDLLVEFLILSLERDRTLIAETDASPMHLHLLLLFLSIADGNNFSLH